MVADHSSTVIKKNHYYPFSMTFGESTDPDAQPYKYNEDTDGGNLGGGYFIHPGYEKKLMSNGHTNSKLDNSHYKHYVGMYGGASPNVKVANGKIQVGWSKNQYGRINLMTPYEERGFHKAHPFRRR